VFIAIVVYLWVTPSAHRKLQDGFTLMFFPALAAAMMIILSLILTVDPQRKFIESKLHMVDAKIMAFSVLISMACWIYFELSVRIGFLIVSPLFLTGYTYYMGMRPWTHALGAGVVITAIVYMIFRVLGVELPTGILPF
jgi:hypothetical protein